MPAVAAPVAAVAASAASWAAPSVAAVFAVRPSQVYKWVVTKDGNMIRNSQQRGTVIPEEKFMLSRALDAFAGDHVVVLH